MSAWLKKLREKMAGGSPAIPSDEIGLVARSVVAASYCQFLVADVDGDFGDDLWPGDDVAKGVTIGKRGLVSFGTFENEGTIQLTVWDRPYAGKGDFGRVLAAPLDVFSNAVTVCAPDEFPGSFQLAMKNGHYRVTAAMREIDVDSLQVDLFFELDDTILTPQVLVADPFIAPAWKETQ